jgi:hypothetical protein
MYGLGRLPSPPDTRDYDLGRYTGLPAVSSRFWTIGPLLDQGHTMHCVGYGFADWGNCLPVCDAFGAEDAERIYYEAKVIDGDPGGESGSTLRSGCKAMQARGRLGAYAFGDLATARDFILTQGPVVFGLLWTDVMMSPDPDGTIHAAGSPLGGHCLLCYGYADGWWYLQNAWGPGWGVGGCCRISDADLDLLMALDGEVCAAVELPAAAAPPLSCWQRLRRRLVKGLEAIGVVSPHWAVYPIKAPEGHRCPFFARP